MPGFDATAVWASTPTPSFPLALNDTIEKLDERRHRPVSSVVDNELTVANDRLRPP
jgi:hypothetical protein